MNADVLQKMDMLYTNMITATTTNERKSLHEQMVNLFRNNEWLSSFWDFVESARLYVKRWVRKIVEGVKTKRTYFRRQANIEWNDIQPMPEGVEQLYLIRLLDARGKLIYSKVGTTTRRTTQRMAEHLKYYAKDGVRKVEVLRLWDCGEIPAEAYESSFRAHYIRMHPGTFKKNDRFINVEFDLQEADEYFRKIQVGE